MSSNTENTEAKLAAYIDGQIDSADRAEIERHLQANPDHRRLVEEMAAQREMLRGLPRASAPADIYDSLQSQLERTTLLDDADTPTPPLVRHSHRSQLMSIAAMLLLAVGLGMVVYWALPPSHPTPAEVASLKQFSAEPASSAASEPVDESKSSEFPLQALLKDENPSDGIVVLVSTNTPQEASRTVTDYLQTNGIHYETINASSDVAQNFFNKPMVRAETAKRDIGNTFGKADIKIESGPSSQPSEPLIVAAGAADKLRELRVFNSNPATTTSADSQNVILARGMTRRQAAELAESLSAERIGQSAWIVKHELNDDSDRSDSNKLFFNLTTTQQATTAPDSSFLNGGTKISLSSTEPSTAPSDDVPGAVFIVVDNPIQTAPSSEPASQPAQP